MAYPTKLAASTLCRRVGWTQRTDPNDPKWRSWTPSNLVGPRSCSRHSWNIPGTRRGPCGCCSAGLGLVRTTIPGNTRGACRLPRCTDTVDSRGLYRTSEVRGSRGVTTRRRDRTAMRQNNSCICIFYVLLLITRQEAESYHGQHKARAPPKTTGAHHGHLASTQTTKGSKRALISARPLLIPHVRS